MPLTKKEMALFDLYNTPATGERLLCDSSPLRAKDNNICPSRLKQSLKDVPATDFATKA
jgi:hypothetical protein